MMLRCKIARVREERQEGKERKEQERHIPTQKNRQRQRRFCFFFGDFVPFGLFEFFGGFFLDLSDLFFVVLVIQWMDVNKQASKQDNDIK